MSSMINACSGPANIGNQPGQRISLYRDIATESMTAVLLQVIMVINQGGIYYKPT